MPTSGDRITFELVRHSLEHITDDMARTIARCGFSPLIRSANDFGTALLDQTGEVIAQGHTSPPLLFAIRHATQAVLKRYADHARGDVYILNDPYAGGGHLPDIFTIMPLLVADQLVGFAASEAHHSDVGGHAAGSNAIHSREIYQEGLRIPPSRLIQAGVWSDILVDLLCANCRFPDLLMGDLQAQIAALRVGEAGILDLIERYGTSAMTVHAAATLDYAERLARAEIGEWPDGRWDFEDWLDAIDDTGPIPIRASLAITGDGLTIDFAGSAPQVARGINCPRASTVAFATAAVRCAMRGPIPNNSGIMRPITVRTPEGSIVHCVAPAPVTGRSLTALRAFDAVIGCLGQAVPERVRASSSGANALITICAGRGVDERVVTEIHFGSWGASASHDGLSGMSSPVILAGNTPVEVIEREYPITVTRYELVQDTCGPGRMRGGPALRREYRVDSETAAIDIRFDRSEIPPPGVAGGGSGTPARASVTTTAEPARECPPLFAETVSAGTVISCATAGAAGWVTHSTAIPHSSLTMCTTI
jgi:N-methylhydantoinase B